MRHAHARTRMHTRADFGHGAKDQWIYSISEPAKTVAEIEVYDSAYGESLVVSRKIARDSSERVVHFSTRIVVGGGSVVVAIITA